MAMLLIGAAVGTIGSLIGAGGGFLLVPILLFFYPERDSVWVASMSMFVVAINATSGSIACILERRIHLRTALLFILAGLPGSALGVWVQQFVDRTQFESIFGVVLLCYSTFLLLKKPSLRGSDVIHAKSELPRNLLIQGTCFSFFVGFAAAFLGIGGGVLHVPMLFHVFEFPIQLATGTSQFILLFTSWFTTVMHIVKGNIHWSDPVLLMLSLGAVIGAQIGSRLSRHVSGLWIMRILAVALAFVGLRLLIKGHVL